MKSATLTVNKEAVMQEVDKATSYTGKKIDEATPPAEGQETAYDRVRTTAATKEILTRFWDEAASMATVRMMRYISSVTKDTAYTAQLSLTERWDEALLPDMNKSLFSYFVSFILSRWFKVANKAEAETYMADATAMLDNVMRGIYFRSAPVREI